MKKEKRLLTALVLRTGLGLMLGSAFGQALAQTVEITRMGEWPGFPRGSAKAIVLSGNYAYQRSIDRTTRSDAGFAPHHQLYLRGDWRFAPGWLANSQINWVGERRREAGDTRSSLSGYHTVDLTLRTQGGRHAWDLAFSVRNLFDADAREPSPFDTPFIAVPGDIPLPGRSFYIQASYRL